jgi:hypothetical protein
MSRKITPIDKLKVQQLYNQFILSMDPNDPTDKKMFDLMVIVDVTVQDNVKSLLLVSLMCNVYYQIYGNKQGQWNKPLTFTPRIKCNDFKILTGNFNDKIKLLEALTIFFNTDATNILPITGKILHDLEHMKVYIQ